MRNNIYEQALNHQGVQWDYADNVLLETIDRNKSLRNQARLLQPLDHDLVDSYSDAMKEGAQFPPLVVYKSGRGGSKFTLIDGNQRLAALTAAGKDSHDLYIVNSSDQQVLDRLTWTFNNLVNGKRLSQEEAIEHALTFVRKYQLPVDQAAREWSVPRWLLSKRVRVEELKEVLDRNNFKRNLALTDDKLWRLAGIQAAGDDVFLQAAQVVNDTGIAANEVEELTKIVKTAATHDNKLAEIDKFANSPAVLEKQAVTGAGRLVTKPSPSMQLTNLMRQLERLLTRHPNKNILRPTGHAYKELRKVVMANQERLTEIFGLGVLPKQEESA